MTKRRNLTRSDIAEKLRNRGRELAEHDVAELSLFGSLSRGEATRNSDVDILVRFRGKETFDRYMDLKFFLEELFGRKVDLVTVPALRPELREKILKEAVRVA